MSASTEIRIRYAVEDDVAVLVEIARRSWLSAFAQSAPIEVIRWWAQHNREPEWYARDWNTMLVAEVGDGDSIALVGLVQPVGNEINGLWVAPPQQRHEIGTMLLTAVEHIMRDVGHTESWLTCSAFNRRAREFYERRGYELTNTVSQLHPSGVAEDVWTLSRVLNIVHAGD